MVFVKVRETYDLHTIQSKISIIGVHTPKADIIKKEYPGLLMQCKAYRPVSVDIRCACASMLPADPLQVGTVEGDVAPEDLFNPILYKALTNKGMSQLEAYINTNNFGTVIGSSMVARNSGIQTDDFNLYYGLLADTHSWKHANPQSGFAMSNVKPLVFEVLRTIGDSGGPNLDTSPGAPNVAGDKITLGSTTVRGNARTMPFLNCTSYSMDANTANSASQTGFSPDSIINAEVDIPAPEIFVAAIVVPPSRLHKLYYRMVVEWTLEFTGIRSITEVTNWNGIAALGSATHYQSYSYSSAKALAGIDEDVLSEDTSMVSTSEGTEIHKVM